MSRWTSVAASRIWETTTSSWAALRRATSPACADAADADLPPPLRPAALPRFLTAAMPPSRLELPASLEHLREARRHGVALRIAELGIVRDRLLALGGERHPHARDVDHQEHRAERQRAARLLELVRLPVGTG